MTVCRDKEDRPVSWFRRPDRSFWLSLLGEAPEVTAADAERRARLARYSLGLAAVFSVLYILLSLIFAGLGLKALLIQNSLMLAGYLCGMWAASLGAHKAARHWLMITLSVQLLSLVWLTGQALGIAVFAVVLAALAVTLFANAEKWPRAFYIVLALLILLAGQMYSGTPRIDLSPLPPPLLTLTQIGNQITAFICILLLLGVFRREVLQSEAGLVAERDRSHRLLHVILPKTIAGRLQQGSHHIADHHPDVTVLFADIAGFTPWAAGQSPQQVVNLLEQVFSRFDALVAAAGVEKIKTIGDAYMVISGAPEPRTDHATVMAGLALSFMNEVASLREETGIPLQLRVGLHTGPVIAGVIGTVRFSYDVWGDTVNTASRMESQGEPGRIHVSADTMRQLESGFSLQCRGTIDVKGKGQMETWWLDRPA